jgi:hypothetical protein
MSFDPFENLPDHLKAVIKELMQRLENIDPEEISKIMNQYMGDDFSQKLQDLMDGGQTDFSFAFDPNMIKNFEILMKNLMGNSPSFTGTEYHKEKQEEAYYEITSPTDGKGEIVVDLPGITDVRQVIWNETDGNIILTATAEDIKYHTTIPIGANMKVQDMFAKIKNSIFILPYQLIDN